MKKGQVIAAVDHWFTSAEWGYDRRTGARVDATERPRHSGDPGMNHTVWQWSVRYGADALRSGVARDQQGARRAIRRVVRSLPNKELKPSCGLSGD